MVSSEQVEGKFPSL